MRLATTANPAITDKASPHFSAPGGANLRMTASRSCPPICSELTRTRLVLVRISHNRSPPEISVTSLHRISTGGLKRRGTPIPSSSTVVSVIASRCQISQPTPAITTKSTRTYFKETPPAIGAPVRQAWTAGKVTAKTLATATSALTPPTSRTGPHRRFKGIGAKMLLQPVRDYPKT
jgi:hypothetical protein